MKKPSRLDRGIFRLFYGISISQVCFQQLSHPKIDAEVQNPWVFNQFPFVNIGSFQQRPFSGRELARLVYPFAYRLTKRSMESES